MSAVGHNLLIVSNYKDSTTIDFSFVNLAQNWAKKNFGDFLSQQIEQKFLLAIFNALFGEKRQNRSDNPEWNFMEINYTALQIFNLEKYQEHHMPG